MPARKLLSSIESVILDSCLGCSPCLQRLATLNFDQMFGLAETNTYEQVFGG